MESSKQDQITSEQISIQMNNNAEELKNAFGEINTLVKQESKKNLSKTHNQLVQSKKKLKETEVKTLSSQQRWYAPFFRNKLLFYSLYFLIYFLRRIRSSWPLLAPIVNSKGFGALASLKDLIGAPKATKDDHHDYEYNDKNQHTTNPAEEDSKFLLVFS